MPHAIEYVRLQDVSEAETNPKRHDLESLRKSSGLDLAQATHLTRLV